MEFKSFLVKLVRLAHLLRITKTKILKCSFCAAALTSVNCLRQPTPRVVGVRDSYTPVQVQISQMHMAFQPNVVGTKPNQELQEFISELIWSPKAPGEWNNRAVVCITPMAGFPNW